MTAPSPVELDASAFEVPCVRCRKPASSILTFHECRVHFACTACYQHLVRWCSSHDNWRCATCHKSCSVFGEYVTAVEAI